MITICKSFTWKYPHYCAQMLKMKHNDKCLNIYISSPNKKEEQRLTLSDDIGLNSFISIHFIMQKQKQKINLVVPPPWELMVTPSCCAKIFKVKDQDKPKCRAGGPNEVHQCHIWFQVKGLLPIFEKVYF